MKEYSQYIGHRFGRLTVLSILVPSVTSKGTMFKCKCDCGNEKVVRPNWVLRDETKYRVVQSCGCLRRESVKQVKKDLVGKRLGRWTVVSRGSKTNYWKCRCICGTEKEIFRGSLTSGHSTSCGCWNAGSAHNRRGALHHCWNPNLTNEDRRKQKNHWGWQNRVTLGVFKRDDYTCVVCRRRGGELAAHHKDSWDWCVKGRYDMGNIDTTCVPCHIDFHRKYGRGKNTKEQFEEFRRARRCLTAA